MSISDPAKIDAMGIQGDTLVLLISDHLVWDLDPVQHLQLLQQKLNTYIHYIDEKGFASEYGGKVFKKYRIEVAFRHPYPDSFGTMVRMAKDRLDEKNITIRYYQVKGEDA